MNKKVVRCREGVFAHGFGDDAVRLHAIARANGATGVVPLGKDMHRLEFAGATAAHEAAHPIATALGRDVMYEAGDNISRFGMGSSASEPRASFRRPVSSITVVHAAP